MSHDSLKSWTESEGLRFLGVAGLDCEQDFARYQHWLEESRQAGMGYLAEHREIRRDPSRLLENARAALIFALPYSCGDQLEPGHAPRIAQYARFRDYHKILWKKGEAIAAKIAAAYPDSQCRVTVDSAPLLERALAAKTAEGFIGKNTLYIHPREGSWLLLGEVLTTAALNVDTPATIPLDRKTKEGGCGPCNLCQVACPTGALDRAYTLDANRCLAYWTIEHRGTIPQEFWPYLKDYYFGCDLCQLACPYNRKGTVGRHPEYLEPRTFPSLFETATMSEEKYRRWFGGTPLTRAKRGGLRRNALIALAVLKDARLAEALAEAHRDPEGPVGETAKQIEVWINSPAQTGSPG